MRLLRVESWQTTGEKNVPEVSEERRLTEEQLAPWLAEAGSGTGTIQLEVQASATWQDLIRLLDLCAAAGVTQVGRYEIEGAPDVTAD